MRTAVALASLALGSLAFVLGVPAQAFTSLPPESSMHDKLTAVAVDAGWSQSATEALQQAVRQPDIDDQGLDPEGKDLTRIDATESYRPEHHCDRAPGTPDAAAFNATVAYIAAQRQEATQKIAAGDANGSVAALGRALHALQDCYSHSNAVDLGQEASAFEAALLLKGTAPPAGLRITGFEPGADDPEDPEGDPYPHKAYAKDSADKNDESKALVEGTNETKFDGTVTLARMGTVAFLQEFTHALPEDQRAVLMQVEETKDKGVANGFSIPAVPFPAVLAGLALVLVARRRWA